MRFLFIYISLLFACNIESQSSGDSFWGVYNNRKLDDTARLRSLINIINNTQEIDSSINLTQQLIIEAKKMKLANWETKGLMLLSKKYFYKSNFPYALKYSLEALKISEALKDSSNIVKNLNTIGLVYAEQKELQKGLAYLYKALSYNKNNAIVDMALINGIGMLYRRLGQMEKSEYFIRKALVLAIKNNNKVIEANCYGSLVSFLSNRSEIDSALFYARKITEIGIETKNDLILALGLYNEGSAYSALNQNDKAIYNLLKADTIAEKNNLIVNQEEIIDELSRVYEKEKKFEKALFYKKKHQILNDSIFNFENSKQLSDLKTNYEVEKKEIELKEKSEKEKQNIIIFSVIFISLLLVFGVVVYFRIQKKKLLEKHQSVLLQQKLMRSQMNPHFLSNCVGAIQSLVLTQKPIIASDYLSDLTQMTRRILESTQEEFVDFESEIAFIQQYLNLNQLLLNNSFDYIIETNNIQRIKIPCAIIQPFVENSIKHGISNLANRRGRILIEIKMQADIVECSITDNGVGVADLNDGAIHRRSFSINSVKERLQILLNRKQIIDLQPQNLLNEKSEIVGCTITIELPYISV